MRPKDVLEFMWQNARDGYCYSYDIRDDVINPTIKATATAILNDPRMSRKDMSVMRDIVRELRIEWGVKE